MSSMIIFNLGVLVSAGVLKTTHPVSMGGLLVAVSIFNSMFLGKLISSWLFYMLFLVFLGGVMVVLLFMVSICGNEKFFYSEGGTSVIFLPAMLVFYSLMNMEMVGGQSFSSLNITLSLYQSEMVLGFVVFMLILVLCLISVVKISSLESGPLVKRL